MYLIKPGRPKRLQQRTHFVTFQLFVLHGLYGLVVLLELLERTHLLYRSQSMGQTGDWYLSPKDILVRF